MHLYLKYKNMSKAAFKCILLLQWRCEHMVRGIQDMGVLNLANFLERMSLGWSVDIPP